MEACSFHGLGSQDRGLLFEEEAYSPFPKWCPLRRPRHLRGFGLGFVTTLERGYDVNQQVMLECEKHRHVRHRKVLPANRGALDRQLESQEQIAIGYATVYLGIVDALHLICTYIQLIVVMHSLGFISAAVATFTTCCFNVNVECDLCLFRIKPLHDSWRSCVI